MICEYLGLNWTLQYQSRSSAILIIVLKNWQLVVKKYILIIYDAFSFDQNDLITCPTPFLGITRFLPFWLGQD